MEWITPYNEGIKFVITLGPLILQGIGTFGSSWVSEENCKVDPDCFNSTAESAGNFSNSSTGYTNNSAREASSGLKELDVTAYALHAGAFSALLLSCIMVVIGTERDEIRGVLSKLLYLVAGILSVVACMTFKKKFPGSSFGLSFKLCLASGLCVLVITSIIVVYFCYNRIYEKWMEYKFKRDVEVQPVESTSAEAPSHSDSTTETHSVKSTSAAKSSDSGVTKISPDDHL